MTTRWRVQPRFVVSGLALGIALLLALIAILDDAMPDVGASGEVATAPDTWRTYYTDAGESKSICRTSPA